MPSKLKLLIKAASRGDFQSVAASIKADAELSGAEGVLQEALANLSFFKSAVIKGRLVKTRVVPLANITKTVQVLLRAGANPNSAQKEYGTPLFSAAGNGELAIARMLIEAGADVDLGNEWGFTPLANAALGGHEKVVAYLLKQGANPRLKDSEGKTALDAATKAVGRDSKFRPTLALLKAAFAKPLKRTTPKPQAAETAKDIEIKPFLEFIWDWGHPEWTLVAVESPLDLVSKAVRSISPAKATWKNVSIRATEKGDTMARLVSAVQTKDCAWTIIYLGMCRPLNGKDFAHSEELAKKLSTQLKIRALTFSGEDTSGAMDYRLFQNGKAKEEKGWENQNESADKEFRKLGVVVPVCYPKQDGKKVWLATRKLWDKKILRADIFDLR